MLLTELRFMQIVLAALVVGLVGTGVYLLPWVVNDVVARETIFIAISFTILFVAVLLQTAKYLDQRREGKPRKANA